MFTYFNWNHPKALQGNDLRAGGSTGSSVFDFFEKTRRDDAALTIHKEGIYSENYIKYPKW